MLGPWLVRASQETPGDEETMVCLHLPDYTSQVVASVLSILYYGETWLQSGAQVHTCTIIVSCHWSAGHNTELSLVSWSQY